MDLSVWQWAFVLGVTFLSALVQGTIGFGYAILAVPILSLLDARLAPMPQIFTALPLTAWAAFREREHLELRGSFWILLGRLPGAALGAGLLMLASAHLLDMLLGGIVLLAVFVLATRVKLRRSPMVDFSASIFSATCGYVSAIGGPPLALLFRDASGPTLRSTLGFLFGVSVLVTIGVRWVSGQISELDVTLGVVLAPVVLLGVWASRFLHALIDRGSALRTSVLALSAAAALGLLLRAVLR